MREACLALEAVSFWWQISLDPESRRLDDRFARAAAAAVEAATDWTRRAPDRAQAWFYLAGSYAPRVLWRALRGQRLTAAREGARIKRALERTLELDPSLVSSHYYLGEAYNHVDQLDAARHSYERAVELEPANWRHSTPARSLIQARSRLEPSW